MIYIVPVILAIIPAFNRWPAVVSAQAIGVYIQLLTVICQRLPSCLLSRFGSISGFSDGWESAFSVPVPLLEK